jgi:CDP-6-deoxy-D-xylo-4-hexulose-3-dehydrase
MRSAFPNESKTKEALAQFILKSQWLSMGEQCTKFEEEFAAFQGAKDAVLFNSGGSANLAMLQTLKNLGKLKDGDRVGFSALTWSTNLMPIIQLGMQPVPIDCEPKTLNVMSNNVENRLGETDYRALFITNALGFAGDLGRIREICDEKNVLLIEDNCEALGTQLFTGKTGSFGEMASFSFYVAHHISTIEGGMVCTDDEELAEMLRIVRANGWDRNLKTIQQHKWRIKYNIRSDLDAKYTFYDLGYNFRPTEITGFLGRYQMRFLEDNIAIREKNYISLESAVKKNPDLIPLDRSHISLLSSFAFPVLCRTPELKERYLDRFTSASVEIRPMIAGNIQKQPFYRKYVKNLYNLPGVDKINDCGFYCGNYPELTEKDLEVIKSCLVSANY